MKTMLVMLLGALVGLSVLAWSLDRLIPETTRQAIAARNPGSTNARSGNRTFP